MNKKALFFDIDGTLWDYSNHIPESTVKAIRAAREKGHEAFICTGRSRSFVVNEDLLGIGFDGIVSSCGAMIEYHGETILYKDMSTDLLERSIVSCRKHGMRLILEGKDYQYMDEEDFANDEYGQKIINEIPQSFRSISDNWGQWDAIKFSVAIDGGDVNAFMAEFEDEMDFIVHDEPVLEAVPKGYSKGTGLIYTCKHIGVDISDSFAFGDSPNDLPMFEVAGTSVAMGNAVPSLKKLADYVTDSLYEDGIYNACKHFGLI